MRDPTLGVSGEATDVSSKRWIKPRATVGFSVLENGAVAFEAGFSDWCEVCKRSRATLDRPEANQRGGADPTAVASSTFDVSRCHPPNRSSEDSKG